MNRSTKSLILNVILPCLLVGAVSGTFVGYKMAKNGPDQANPTLAQKNENSSQAPASEAAQITRSSAETAPTVSLPAPAPSTEIVSSERTPDSAYPTPAPEQIEKLGDKNWTPGTVLSREADEKNREVSTVEQLPDGSMANRTYRQDGSLKAESVTYDDGANMNRSFFESGGVKVAMVKRADGSTTSLLYDSTGVPTQQTTQFPDGTQVYNDYNDHGGVNGAYRVSPDGTSSSYGNDEPSE